MALELIAALVASLLNIPLRLQGVAAGYLLSLMVEAPKHTLRWAAEVAGGSTSRYSRLLSDHPDLARESLVLISRRVARRLAKKHKLLVKGAPWTVGILIDATIHPRSSLKMQNVQCFNHGEGFVVGHQWTNIVLLMAGEVVPLPPIAFLTKAECRERGVAYKTEHDRIIDYLRELKLSEWIGQHDPSKVVVITDSGYDSKKLAKAVLSFGWAWLSSLKASRTGKTAAAAIGRTSKWRRIDALFRAVKRPAPWKTVRLQANAKRRRKTYRARSLIGRLKGIPHDLALVCTEKSKKGRRYFACSVTELDVGVIVRAYELRWRVELFHRATKGQTGILDAGLASFEAVRAHVHWSYCAFLLLHELEPPREMTLIERQRWLRDLVTRSPWVERLREVVAMRTQYGGAERAKRLAAAALRGEVAA
jgi:hypothetical protein